MKWVIAPQTESNPVNLECVMGTDTREQNKGLTLNNVRARPGSTTVPLTLPIVRPILQMDNLTETGPDWAGKSVQRSNVLGC